MDIMRLAQMGITLAVLFAGVTMGCAAGNPVSPAVPFETKLLNTISQADQLASQLNYTPNTQLNQTTQAVWSNAAASFPIASLVGTGNATTTNATAQAILNNVTQTQDQNQLVL
jgi:hypothetical protein